MRTTLGRLTSEEQFGGDGKIGADGEVTRLRDVARVTLGADASYAAQFTEQQRFSALQIIQKPGR
ncbi:efflux RND transporter permease subunit [Salmonella enterica subsp. enterica]|nr:efflux RND transporter permease subunit [Salmonella enterica subsp. enterica]